MYAYFWNFEQRIFFYHTTYGKRSLYENYWPTIVKFDEAMKLHRQCEADIYQFFSSKDLNITISEK